MRLKAKSIIDNEKRGFWHIASDDCPLRPHALALDQKPPQCLAGLVTNMQGAVVVHRCKHMHGDLDVGEGGPWVDCTKESDDAQEA